MAQEADQPIRCWCWCGSTRGSNVGRCKPTYQGGGSGWLCWFVGVCVGVRLVGGGRGFPTNQLLRHWEAPAFVQKPHHFRPSSPLASRHSNIWFQVPGSSVLARVALGESGPEALSKGSWRGPTTSVADRHRLAGIAVPSDQAASQSPRPLVGNG